MPTRFKNPRLWIYGLGSAFISGSAIVVACMVVDPVSFNLDTGLARTLKVALVSGLVSAANYLKQSPLPPVETTDTQMLEKPEIK